MTEDQAMIVMVLIGCMSVVVVLFAGWLAERESSPGADGRRKPAGRHARQRRPLWHGEDR